MPRHIQPLAPLAIAMSMTFSFGAAADEPAAAHQCSLVHEPSFEMLEPSITLHAAASLAASTVQVQLVGDASFVTAWGPGARDRAQALFDIAAAEWASAAGLDLELCLADVLLISGGSDPWQTTTDSFGLLFDFEDWARANLSAEGTSRDLVVLLTGQDLAQGTGLSYQSVVCRSGAYGITEGAVFSEQREGAGLAHQIGHLIGARHDGDGNNCDPSRFVMSATAGPQIPQTGISSCSVTAVQEYLADLARFGIENCLTEPCPSVCSADFNNDGFVESGDIGAFIDAFLSSDPALRTTADINGDGFVESGDIAAFVSLFLAGCD